jgi:hypothetical protein
LDVAGDFGGFSAKKAEGNVQKLARKSQFFGERLSD